MAAKKSKDNNRARRDVSGCFSLLTFYFPRNYEANRLFRDRLVSTQSGARFDRIIGGVLKAQWDATINLKDGYYSTWAFPSTGMISRARAALPRRAISLFL